jgi:hypothetical protein
MFSAKGSAPSLCAQRFMLARMALETTSSSRYIIALFDAI